MGCPPNVLEAQVSEITRKYCEKCRRQTKHIPAGCCQCLLEKARERDTRKVHETVLDFAVATRGIRNQIVRAKGMRLLKAAIACFAVALTLMIFSVYAYRFPLLAAGWTVCMAGIWMLFAGKAKLEGK